MIKTAAEYFKRTRLNVEVKTNEQIELNWKSTNPKLMTYWSAKGLQFEAVFIPGCEQVREDTKRPLYVAMTRSYQSLYILYSGSFPSLLSGAPKGLYETSLVAKETELL
jgi:superfamily I DNA/RNA helicase